MTPALFVLLFAVGWVLVVIGGAWLGARTATEPAPGEEPGDPTWTRTEEVVILSDHEQAVDWAMGEILRVLSLEGAAILERERTQRRHA